MENIKQLKNLDFSKLHRYSTGLVIDDNVDNKHTIKVYPNEKLYNLGDDLSLDIPNVTTIQTKAVDIHPKDKEAVFKDGKEVIHLNKTKYILANWLNKSEPNRITPPNVCKGEKVVLYRFSNTDEFYWETEETDLRLRKEDHVIHTYSDKPSLDPTEDPINDRYTITFSPKNKELSIHTTDKYGEYTTYDIKIKTDEGYLEFKDGKGNSIKLDSKADSLTTNINKTINESSTNTNLKIGERLNVKLDKFNVTNGTAEVMATLSEWVQFCIDDIHVGNLGLPSKVDSATKANYQKIKDKIDSFI